MNVVGAAGRNEEFHWRIQTVIYAAEVHRCMWVCVVDYYDVVQFTRHVQVLGQNMATMQWKQV